MLGTVEVDEDYFTPVSSTSLADVFSRNPDHDSSLQYIPPKPQTSQEEINVEKNTKCILACALFGYQWVNNEYQAKGRLGFAILKILKTGDYTIILYDTNKVTLSQVLISSHFEVTIKGKSNISYYDNAKIFWSLYGTEEEVNKIREMCLKLNGKIRYSSKTEQNSENLNKQESTNSKRKKDTADVESDGDSLDTRRAKMAILNRMANMGQSMLPTQTASQQNISDSSDSNEDINYPVKHRNKAIAKHSNTVKATSNTVKTHDNIAPIDTYSRAQLVPLPPPPQYPPLMTGNNDFSLFLTEQRVCNSELRINFNRLSDKVEQILEKVKFLKVSNESSINTSVHSDITQKLLTEYENKIKCYEDIIRGMDTQYVKEKMLLHITSKDTSHTASMLDITDNNADNTEDNKISKLCSEIETANKKLDQLLGKNPETVEKILEEISDVKNILEIKTTEITQICNSTSTQSNVESKIKTLMNETFQSLCENIEDDKQYTGKEIKKLLASMIKKSTVQSFKETNTYNKNIHVAFDNIQVQELIINVGESSSSDSDDSLDFD